MVLEDLKELMSKRENELVASGFIEVRQENVSDLSDSSGLGAFYYNIGRELELSKDPEYGRLRKEYKELVEANNSRLSGQNLRKMRSGYRLPFQF